MINIDGTPPRFVIAGAMIITEQLIQRARRNISQDPWAVETAAQIIKRAAPWLGPSDERTLESHVRPDHPAFL